MLNNKLKQHRTNNTTPKIKSLADENISSEILRRVKRFFCALTIIFIFAITPFAPTLQFAKQISQANEPAQDSTRSRILNRLTSIIPYRNSPAPATYELPTNVLPGFGFVDNNENLLRQNSTLTGLNFNVTENNLTQPTALTNYTANPHPQIGSLEFVPPAVRNVPAIYIDGEGYVPINHPSIEPYIDPLKNTPETNPNIVLIPEWQLAASKEYRTFAQFAIPYNYPIETAARTIDNSGNTTISLPNQNHTEPITVSAKKGWQRQNEKYDVLFLSDDCTIRQGNNSVQAPKAVVWISREKNTNEPREVAVYLESESPSAPLVLEFDPESINAQIIDKRWFGKFHTTANVQTLIMHTEPTPDQDPAIFKRALKAMNPDTPIIEQVQYTETTQKKQDVAPFRRISLNPRGDNEMSIDIEPIPDNPDRAIFIISKGMNLIIEGITGENILTGDVVDISADHAIIWSVNPKNLQQNGKTNQDSKADFEVYLEGNIIFRDGERVIKAKRMYYDAKNKIAHVIDGELTTPIVGLRGFSGTLRIKSEILQKISEGNFTAKNSWVTTSMLGQPTWSLRSRTMSLTDKYYAPVFSNSEPVKRQILSAENNTLVIGRVPVFYWPWLAADAKEPTYYIKSISVGSSGYYGYTVRTEWNPFQLFNIQNRPDWLEGSLGVSWLEKRGIGHGIKINYSPHEILGKQTNARGHINYWGINDISNGDQLGGARNPVIFPKAYRYIFSWSHQQEMKSLFGWRGDWSVNASVGKVSDRNVSPYYNHAAWVNSENQTTSVEVAKTGVDSSLKLRFERSLDEFYTNANQLPRLDHYLIGRSFLYDKLTFYSHTRVGYIDYNVAESPYAPNSSAWYRDANFFRYLPWELNTGSLTSAPPNPNNVGAAQPDVADDSFEIFSTRAEVDLPFNISAIRVVPYVLGEFSHWGADRSGNDTQRLYYRGGVRLSLPFWKVMPNCSSRTWYVNGLAHKITLDSEISYAQSNKGLDNLILTDSLDRWAVEDFRRRYSVTSFLKPPFYGTIPQIFDPRYYAYRSGIAGNVTAGNMEIADDLTLARFGMTHRWQTKRGPVGKRHIVDWITFATHLNYYPDESQNFGESVGLIDYDFMWHVGDRFSIFSSGLYDVFDDGQEITRIGGVWNRPARGNITIMYDRLYGSAIKRDYLTLQVGYTMNEKYAVSYSTSYDITKNPWSNVGHNFIFTRTGESFRLMVGAVYSESLSEWSFTFGIEPVFMRGIANKLQRISTTAQQQFTQ
ncbi:MAG: hypothetical protein LBT09_12105 [Planctomycetaceae bacterium]|nr:hypothetical protein [Planctomycetaceae bacterium]